MKTKQLKNIKVPLQVVLGDAEVTLDELASIGRGSVICLDSMAGKPVSLLAAGEVIAEGEVVVIDENFGIRVTELVDKKE